MTPANPKPARGSARLERHLKRRAIEQLERHEKTKVRRRDRGRCRWPSCEHMVYRPPLEVAHLDAKGMGGDHGIRSRSDQMILLCQSHHRGSTSLHSGDLRIRPLTDRGTDGPCAFLRRATSHGPICGEFVVVRTEE